MEHFRFWCQKILPLVYDDSLSYYELLCKVVNYLNKVIDSVNTQNDDIKELSKQFDRLNQYVTDYFKNLDVQEEINHKLDEMAKDGTLDDIINHKIFEDLNTDIANARNWGQTNADMQPYRNAVVNNATTYLRHVYASDCVVGDTYVTPSAKYCWKYNPDYGYMALFGRYKEFRYSQKESTPDGNLPIVYADCAVFTSLLNKCIPFEQSPYFYAVEGLTKGGVDTKTLYRSAMENGTIESMPYTYDMLNNYNTSTMAAMHDKIGVGITQISSWTNGQTSPTFMSLDNLETGDMLYRGISGNSYYKGIDHCGTFIKTLEELNKCDAVNKQCTFKTYNDHTSERGYVIECTGPQNDGESAGGYENRVRLITLEDWCLNKTTVSWINAYYAKPVSCVLTSNKFRAEAVSNVQCYDFNMDVAQERNSDGGYRPAWITSTIAGGLIIKTNEDLDDYTYNGYYQCNSAAVKASLKNAPAGSAYNNFKMHCFGFTREGKYGIQVAVGFSVSSYQYIAIRTKGDSTWSPWVNLSTLTSEPSNVGVKEAVHGTITTASVPAGGHVDVEVKFTKAFKSVPQIMLQRKATSSSTLEVSKVTAGVITGSNSVNGFKFRVFNGENTAFGTTWDWIAMVTAAN